MPMTVPMSACFSEAKVRLQDPMVSKTIMTCFIIAFFVIVSPSFSQKCLISSFFISTPLDSWFVQVGMVTISRVTLHLYTPMFTCIIRQSDVSYAPNSDWLLNKVVLSDWSK